MEELIKLLSPLIIPFIGGGTVLTFILKLLQRHDVIASEKSRNEKFKLERGRMYEIAYRRADNWGRNLSQLVAPAVLSYKREDRDTATEILNMVCEFLLERLPNDGGWRMKEHPNFIKESYEEMRQADALKEPDKIQNQET